MADGTTDATGAFLVNDIPGNAEFGITISKTGYATISQEAEKIVSAVGDEPLKDGANYYDITMYKLGQSFQFKITGGDATLYLLPATDKMIVQACFALKLDPIDSPDSVTYYLQGKYTRQTDVTEALVVFTDAPDFSELQWAGIGQATILIEDTTDKFLPSIATENLTTLEYTNHDNSPAVSISVTANYDY